MRYLRDIVALGPRPAGSEGMKRQQAYIRQRLKADRLEEDVFAADTPVGKIQFRNLIAKFQGVTDDIIVIASHYDTNYSLKHYVGANDGASSTALALELANQVGGSLRGGPSIWFVWFDGEEAFKEWTETDSLYGSRHLATRWAKDGTAKRIKAFLLLDMVGDKELNIVRDTNSSPQLTELVQKAASNLGVQSHFLRRTTTVLDDHLPFAKLGVPVIDLIDFEYGYANAFWHTQHDTTDKVSANSLQIVGDVVLETVRLLSD